MDPQDKDQPVHIHPRDRQDEQDDVVATDNGAGEVIRPARNAVIHDRKRRGQHNLTASTKESEELHPSKTWIKKQMHDLRDLGAELAGLGKDKLDQLELPENLSDAIREMKGINKYGAQRRQMQYIGKLMREVDTAPILAKLDAWRGTSQQHVAYMHRLEKWRDRLMENNDALTELLSAHPQADAQRLRTLIRGAQKEIAANRPPKNYREIFQMLKEIIPEF